MNAPAGTGTSAANEPSWDANEEGRTARITASKTRPFNNTIHPSVFGGDFSAFLFRGV